MGAGPRTPYFIFRASALRDVRDFQLLGVGSRAPNFKLRTPARRTRGTFGCWGGTSSPLFQTSRSRFAGRAGLSAALVSANAPATPPVKDHCSLPYISGSKTGVSPKLATGTAVAIMSRVRHELHQPLECRLGVLRLEPTRFCTVVSS
ncbi:hypothetical protein NDU88_009678 [Pleurodeles waltl]|uniref:Uncharacterized protein n=1 Tax=Pleurodeles waltl TaxID=8319 RepID=A0AAV7QS99_PLEWA|nr:hypothetical protein NDU88_009678 [Pleurodeles waltl]